MLSTKEKRAKVDSLIDHLWRNGYLTISRKFGRYLPSPNPVGNYEVDAIAKYKKKIAIGITLSEEELNDPNLITKLNFLIHPRSKESESKITLFVGVPNKLIIKADMILSSLKESTREKIMIVSLPEEKEKSGF
ncbi:MAG: hypothetical protein RDU14_15075 [Melioribacteraceae bacterium]|jgi:hypothetical protein|nr:hypothetical protein [Melioribacteraceae bacterium]